jgi:hypothetical protein
MVMRCVCVFAAYTLLRLQFWRQHIKREMYNLQTRDSHFLCATQEQESIIQIYTLLVFPTRAAKFYDTLFATLGARTRPIVRVQRPIHPFMFAACLE